MTKNELKALERAQVMTDYPVYWVPITWASNLVTQAWERGYMKVFNVIVQIVNLIFEDIS